MLYRSLKVTEETQLPIHKEECDIQVLRKGESHTLSFLISTSIIVIDAAPSILIALDDISAQKHAQRQIIEQNIALHESNLLLIQQTDQLKELTEHLDQTNSQLQSSEAMYRLLAENVSDVIWVFDINTLRFKYISPSAFQLQGYTSEEVLVLSLEETVAPDYLPELFARFRERYLVYIEQNIDFPEYVDETQLICKNGQRVWVEISTRFVRGIEGVEVVGISRNIENRKKAEATITQKAKELTALNATKDKLFSIIGHDLKNPFSLILNYANRLTRQFDTIDDKKKYEYVKGISETAQESYQLLQNLLAWSQSQKGGLQLDRAEIDLAAIFADAFALYKHVAEKKGIELKNEIPRGAFVLADLNTTDTVFRNLVSNAIKYTPKGGNIAATSQWVATHPDYPWPHWLICVTDTGVGISETVLDKLFQIGTSTSSPGTDNEHGTGLGLVVCKDFITLNKGVIWIESALGKGTTVQIRLASMQTVQPDVLENESLVTESSPIYEPYDYRKLELDTRIVVKIRPFYELAMDTLSIRAIRQFLQKAQELAAMYEHDALAIFAQQVEDALKRFDIPEIEKLLQSQKDRLV
jgi:PAS domain S-box-containing protein